MKRRLPLLLGLVLVPGQLACGKRPQTAAPNPPAPAAAPVTPAATASGPRPKTLLRGAVVMTAAGKIYERADVLLEGDQIVAVGPELAAPGDAKIVDLSGKTLTPGIIDTHSHIGVYAAPGLAAHADGNEAIAPNTAGVRAVDAYFPQDPQIDRARAGGITTMQILPGSANLFGGRSVTVRLTPGVRSAAEARFPGAPAGLKMACGENPKRVYGEKGGPQTRMGNVAGYRDAFQKASEYQRSWTRYRKDHAEWLAKKDKPEPPVIGDDYDDDEPKDGKVGKDGKPAKKKGDEPQPPAVDFALETIAGVLRGEILVHNHCYRADEMAIMLDLAATYGFKIRSFHHATDAYKIADKLAAAGTAASVWADWWGFKAESFDGIRENAALLTQAGARAIIHSDSAVGIQRLNQEAAKAMHAGRRAGIPVSDDQALRWITANPAWALGIDAKTGTLEPGKLADLVVWSGNPFSVYTIAEQVYIAGEQVYVRGSLEPRTDFELGYLPGDLERSTPPLATTNAGSTP
ncbi:amidohydrolase [Nannocystis sp.]|uniref:amidohydrolase n=1 Tax=Nannocystis sp. TaxID=1962667 RepID=UPI0025DCABCE|nr:amidohydrolase [Nannocystis sp.]MBK7824565.1 amidohydrolase [Nannocystis sp.]